MKKHRWIWITLAVLLVLLFTGCIATGEYFINYAFKRNDNLAETFIPGDGETPEERNRMKIIKGNRKIFNETVAEWLPTADTEEMWMENSEGFKLHAKLVRPENPSHKYFILCHGYQGRGDWMLPYAYVFEDWGWNTLVLDMKSHGESEGKWIGMGWKDKDDLSMWIDRVIELDPEAEIVLLGVSMGGATVMMTSGLELPGNVKAIISDCGYTNVWDVFADQLEAQHGIPAFPILHSASLMNRMHNGFFLNDADAVSMLEKADPELPMLFIQGEFDNFVPMWMLDKAYDTKRGIKEKLVVPDTDHGNSYVRFPELYFGTIKDFVEQHVGL